MISRLHNPIKQELQLHHEVVTYLDQNPGPWALACSGGVDSLALLYLICTRYAQERRRMHVLHFDHGVQKNSPVAAEKVRVLCNQLGVAFHLGKPGKPVEPKEHVLRALRHAFFQEKLQALHIRTLFLGHHQDDLAEHFLLRLSRGSGLGGLAGLRPIRYWKEKGCVYVRPLLNLSKAALVEFLKAQSVDWVEDPTNTQDTFLRNRLRNTVLPAWKTALGERFGLGLERTQARLLEDNAAFQAWVDKECAEHRVNLNGLSIPTSWLCGKPVGFIRRVCYLFLEKQGLSAHSLAQNSQDGLIGALTEGCISYCVDISPEKRLVIKDGILRVAVQKKVHTIFQKSVALPFGSSLYMPDTAVLHAEWVQLDAEIKAAIFKGNINPSQTVYCALNVPIFVRYWRPGDRYQPLGAPGSRKVKKLFTEKEIPQENRAFLPFIVTESEHLIWVPGLPISEAFKIKNDAASALRLTYEKKSAR